MRLLLPILRSTKVAHTWPWQPSHTHLHVQRRRTLLLLLCSHATTACTMFGLQMGGIFFPHDKAIHQLGVLQFKSILTLPRVSADPMVKLSPLRLPPTSDAYHVVAPQITHKFCSIWLQIRGSRDPWPLDSFVRTAHRSQGNAYLHWPVYWWSRAW